MAARLRFRQVHLDFHTSEHIPDVGSEFDPDEFAETLKAAHVDSVCVFAKCHHGWSYYPTKVGAPHPHLARPDLLGEMIEACHARDIQAPVYVTVLWDERSASLHPEWRAVDRDGRLQGPPPGQPGWRTLCLNSGVAEYVMAQAREILERYDRVDGFFFDIVFHRACFCERCLTDMRSRGMDPFDERAHAAFQLEVERRFLRQTAELVRSIQPDCRLFFNGRLRLTGRVHDGFRPEVDYYSHLEIESLPSGGWGYNHFPLFARYMTQFGLDVVSHSGRFHKSWGDFGGLKNKAALEYECFRMLAHGVKCEIGDQLHPRGRLDRATYEQIGGVYRQVEEVEPWCEGAALQADIGVLLTAGSENPLGGHLESEEGAMRMLMELHHQFRVVDSLSDFGGLRVLILPDRVEVDAALAEKLSAFCKSGGKLLVSYRSGEGLEEKVFVHALRIRGELEWTPHFVRLSRHLGAGPEDFDFVMYEPAVALAGDEGTVLAHIAKPYFNRTGEHFCSHSTTPVECVTDLAEVLEIGNVIYIASAIFRAYRLHGNNIYKSIVARCLDRLLPDPLLRTNAPSTAEINVLCQGDPPRTIVHILHYIPERRTPSIDIVEDVIPLHQVEIHLRIAEVSRVYLAPGEEDLPFEKTGMGVRFVVPEVCGHAMVVVE